MQTDPLTPDPLKKARHDLRGGLNALKLAVSAFAYLDSKQEALEFLDMIDHGADKTAAALDALEEALQGESAGAAHPERDLT